MVLEGVKEWVASTYEKIINDEDALGLLADVTLRAISLYITYKLTIHMTNLIHNPNFRRDVHQARAILNRIGLSEKEIKLFLSQANGHELMVLKNFVTNVENLDTMTNIMGLEKAKEIIERNLTFALRLSKSNRFNNLIKLTPGMLLYGHWLHKSFDSI